MSYTTYLKSKEDCDAPSKSWNKEGVSSKVPEIDYPEFSTSAVNAAITKWKTENSDQKWFLQSEQERLMKDLDPVRIGNFTGFKTLEVARIGYRTRMNQLFACSIVSSRINSVVWLQELTNKKIKTKDGSITEKLNKEIKKYREIQTSLKCNETGSEKKEDILSTITNSSAHQYCHYRYYLDYLESNTSDVLCIQNIEKGIGAGSGTQTAINTSEYASQANIYSSSIAREITRADTTLPKALRTFLEMDQTYQIHILLADFIYADYVNLRKSIAYYMVLSSQLYQKAYNAQSTNK
jgi:hypothetical protein